MRAAAVMSLGRGGVTFVGLGPGDPMLRTERAAQRMREADVVFEGDSVRVDVMVELAREGRRVVRTVKGDPLEHPVGVREIIEVAGAAVEVEVVPGIGSVAAAGAFAAVIGRAVSVAGRDVEGVLGGLERDSPVTIVFDPSLPSQRVRVVVAYEVADLVRPLGEARVLLAFGVPQDPLRWFERRPLFGKRVLVTRAREQAGSAAALLRDYGADVVIVPTIEIRDPVDRGPLDRALTALCAGDYRWAVFTSANGVEQTWKALASSGFDARAFGAAKIAAIGPATARALEIRGLRADVVAKEFVGEELARAILAAVRADIAAPRVLLPRAAKARDVVPEMLRAAGCTVDVVAAYETHAPPRETVESLVEELEGGKLDAVTFTSSSTVENFCDLLGPRTSLLLSRVRVATIGPITSETARVRGIQVDVTAGEYTVPGLVRSLADSYRPSL